MSVKHPVDACITPTLKACRNHYGMLSGSGLVKACSFLSKSLGATTVLYALLNKLMFLHERQVILISYFAECSMVYASKKAAEVSNFQNILICDNVKGEVFKIASKSLAQIRILQVKGMLVILVNWPLMIVLGRRLG